MRPAMAACLLINPVEGGSMSAILIWVHSQEAKLFHLKAKSIHVETVPFKIPKHFIENSAGLALPYSPDGEEKFFRHLVKNLKKKEPARWLIMGPTQLAPHFHRFLLNHHADLAVNVIGVERVETMPDSEILSKGRQILHHYYLNQRALS
jgi:hypothetical protein